MVARQELSWGTKYWKDDRRASVEPYQRRERPAGSTDYEKGWLVKTYKTMYPQHKLRLVKQTRYPDRLRAIVDAVHWCETGEAFTD